MKWPADPQTGDYLNKADAQSWARQNGTTKRPDAPRNLQAQSGARKILVTWDAPEVADGVIGYKIYVDSESSLLDTLYDANVRQYNVPASSGSTPPKKNVFISAFSKRFESVKVQVQGSATAEAAAPSDPSPPAGSAASGQTGGSFAVDGGSGPAKGGDQPGI